MSLSVRAFGSHLAASLAPLGAGLAGVLAWPGDRGHAALVGLSAGLLTAALVVVLALRQARRLSVRLAAQAERAQGSAGTLTRLAKQVNVSAGEISRSMEELSRGAGLQRQLIEQTSALLGEMSRSIERASRSAEDAARSSAEASAVAQSGGQLAGQAVEKMRGVFQQVERYAQRVFEFGERSKEIGNIVRVITEVAQQTHLLAINATIEAVRAGEAGRGFAVVAEEIRHLAENTSRSSERIARLVEEVVAGSQEAVQAAQASTQQLSEGREELASILDALKAIVTSVTAGSDRVQIINRLAREQIAGAAETVRAFDNIAQVAQKNSSSTVGALQAAEAQSNTLLEMTQQTALLGQLAASLEAEAARYRRAEARDGNAERR
jgi:methyl-accepting chemotaxis protein